jgi:hypothetical protein
LISAGVGPQVALRRRWAAFLSPSCPVNGFKDAIDDGFMFNKYFGSNEPVDIGSNLPSVKFRKTVYAI